MVESNSPAAESEEQALVIERIFDAPRELVWKAWAEPEHFMRWYGPKGFTTPYARSISAWAVSGSTACDRLTAGRCGALGPFARSFRWSGS